VSGCDKSRNWIELWCEVRKKWSQEKKAPNGTHPHTAETNTTTTVYGPFSRDHPGEPVPEENFWTLWCKGRLTEAGTLTIRLGATPSGLTNAHFHNPPYILQAGCPSYRPTNSVKTPKAR